MAWKGYVIEFLHVKPPRYYYGVCSGDVFKSVEDLLKRARKKEVSVANGLVELIAYPQDGLGEPVYKVTDLDTGKEKDPEAWLDEKIKQLVEKGDQACSINVDHLRRRIRRLRSALTVNSGFYYDNWQGGETRIGDHRWDELAYMLVDLQKRYHWLLPHINFFDDYFNDFDGSTGMHLPYRDAYFMGIMKVLTAPKDE
jgi:hypothetical protein